jgi:demethylmenaquinone methyltransferase/2-methoxy-6-polyprenyl-1,4-benzoquinol methylase
VHLVRPANTGRIATVPAPVKHLFARISPRYDLVNSLLSCGQDRSWRRRALAMLPAGDGRLLDLACGTGVFGRQARAAGRAGRVTAVDCCLAMLRRGRFDPGIDPCAADARVLPFADATFDGCLVGFGWRNFADTTGSLAEIRRVLRSGGRLLILEFFRPTSAWPRWFHATYGAVVIPALGGFFTGCPAAYRHLHRSIATFLTVDAAAVVLARAGFTVERRRTMAGGVCHALVAQRI